MLGKYLFRLFAEKVLPEEIEIKGSRCLNNDRNFLCCRGCVRICPRRNLSLQKNDIPKKHDRCTGCGLCISICPTAALNFKELERTKINSRLIQAAQSRSFLKPVCKKLKKSDSSGAILTGCPGSFSLARLIIPPVLGSELYLPFADCREAGCSNFDRVAPWIKNQVEFLKKIFPGCRPFIYTGKKRPGSDGSSSLSGDTDEDDEELDRREVFSSLARKSGEVLEDLTEMGKEELQKRYPGAGKEDSVILPRELLQIICRISAENNSLDINDNLIISARPEFREERCTCCRRCEKLCPTGAIKFTQENPFFYPGRCTGCHVCRSSCPQDALKFVGGLTHDEFTAGRIVLEPGFRLGKCPDCGAPFNLKSGRDKCYFC
ncbi:4Fe-4S dicluster domain-containing protein [Halarsenatibacter silvermanii]|uniref:4Fe-4S binding domain-containing protein n=1 Tax=Halarsenatibacter silvermanii TaxID=321763 RepID=A0A1G9SUU5_9FIRM|nr:4Fe-4S binding protein [Halarsenatibacter silvermanii]SDM39203.1 4Fe-4S binding domain-containing protein [Halarsenatibacter silvermanii]